MVMLATIGRWRAEDLDTLPDDGNKYEVVAGQLYVTPNGSIPHASVIHEFFHVLDAYVRTHGLGRTWLNIADLKFSPADRVMPDLAVIPRPEAGRETWDERDRPFLVMECLSRTTAWRDRAVKRTLYRGQGIPEYWIVDRWERTVTVVRPGQEDRVEKETLVWSPVGAAESLSIDLPALFRAALDG
jgi:Uma2 family endonuclease